MVQIYTFSTVLFVFVICYKCGCIYGTRRVLEAELLDWYILKAVLCSSERRQMPFPRLCSVIYFIKIQNYYTLWLILEHEEVPSDQVSETLYNTVQQYFPQFAQQKLHVTCYEEKCYTRDFRHSTAVVSCNLQIFWHKRNLL